MKLKYYGHSCFSLSFEGGPVLVTDPFDETVTYPPCNAACDAALVSHDHFDHNCTRSLSGSFATLSSAGAWYIGGVCIAAIDSFHDKERGALRGPNLLFRIESKDLSIAHLGDLGHMPDPSQQVFLRDLDLLLLPIGGTYTIDTPEAEQLIRILKPRHAVAMHFRTDAFEINIATCDAFARDMGAAFMPREIEVTRETLGNLPEVMILDYRREPENK